MWRSRSNTYSIGRENNVLECSQKGCKYK
jgi:hypothetical protein